MPVISAEEQAKVDEYRRILYTTQEETDLVTNQPRQVIVPTPLLQAYQAGSQVYQDAVLRYNALRINANTSTDPHAVLDFAQNAPIYRRQVQDALAAWVSGGYKYEVEMMETYIAQVTSRTATEPAATPWDPAAWDTDTWHTAADGDHNWTSDSTSWNTDKHNDTDKHNGTGN